MNDIIYYAKWIIIIEIALVILFLVLAYATKLYYIIKNKNVAKETAKIAKILTTAITNKNLLRHADIRYLQKSSQHLLPLIDKFDEDHQGSSSWQAIRQQLVTNVFHEIARKSAKSRRMLQRYLAVECFSFGINADDEAVLIQLMRDPILLISLNATQVAFKYPSSQLINAAIDVFSKGRRLQQAVFSSALSGSDSSVARIVAARITQEADPYIKSFCYRLLAEHFDSNNQQPVASVTQDLQSDNLELKLTVMNYLASQEPKEALPVLRPLLTNSHWQVRTRALQLLGSLHDVESAAIMGEMLRDSEWWIRFRSAEALGKLGEKGIAILKAQSEAVDRFAYEAAKPVLDFLALNAQ